MTHSYRMVRVLLRRVRERKEFLEDICILFYLLTTPFGRSIP